MISLSRLLWLCSSSFSSFIDISVLEVSDGDSTSLIGFSHFRLLQFGSSLCFAICSVLRFEGLPIIGDFPLFCRCCLQSGDIGSVSVLVSISLNRVVLSVCGVFVFENCPGLRFSSVGGFLGSLSVFNRRAFFLSRKVDSVLILFCFDELCCNSSFRNSSSSSLISFLLCPSLAR